MKPKIIYKPGEEMGHNITLVKEIEPHLTTAGAKKRRALFRCPCGKVFESGLRCIIRGKTTNCGCGANSGHQKHGLYGTKLRRCWGNIKTRCTNPTHKQFKDYGGRGIKIHPPWVHDFKAFYSYVTTLPNYGPPGLSLDRIENDGNYEPGNLRWSTYKQQNNNTRKQKLH